MEVDRISLIDTVEEVDLFQIKESEKSTNNISYPLFFPADQLRVPQFIIDRGFNKKILRKWGCGLGKGGSLLIPVYNQFAKLVGWIERFPPNREKRYLNHPFNVFKKSTVLFGYPFIDREKEFICLTEGALDTIWMNQHGFNSLAILGVSLSDIQLCLLNDMNIREIVLCFDNDNAGVLCTEKIYKSISKYFLVSTISIPQGKKDVQDIRDEQELRRVIDSRYLF